jgi:hypothetical protein
MIQALAYCVLVEDQMKISAPYALVIYAGQMESQLRSTNPHTTDRPKTYLGAAPGSHYRQASNLVGQEDSNAIWEPDLHGVQ